MLLQSTIASIQLMCPSNESQYYGNENLVKGSLTRDFRSRSSTKVSLGSGSNNVSPVPFGKKAEYKPNKPANS